MRLSPRKKKKYSRSKVVSAPTVLVAEPSPQLVAAFRLFLGSVAQLGFVNTVEEALRVVRGAAPPKVLIAPVHAALDGEALSRALRSIPGRRIGVILVYPADEGRAAERAQLAQADVLVMAPMKKQQVLGALQSTLRLLDVEDGLAVAQAALAQSADGSDAAKRVRAHHVTDEAFFRKYMLLEVKRSRRYHYPVTLVLLALDGMAAFLAQASEPDKTKVSLRDEVLQALLAMLRDVDVVMAFGDDKFLVFLPHTARAGSLIVAERLVLRLSQLNGFPSGTASAGIGCYEPQSQSQVSFASLVKEAMTNLKTAQVQGGNRFESGTVVAPPKRPRISLG
jgi:diguanylate cyclase (GGDEF)-like protein